MMRQPRTPWHEFIFFFIIAVAFFGVLLWLIVT